MKVVTRFSLTIILLIISFFSLMLVNDIVSRNYIQNEVSLSHPVTVSIQNLFQNMSKMN